MYNDLTTEALRNRTKKQPGAAAVAIAVGMRGDRGAVRKQPKRSSQKKKGKTGVLSRFQKATNNNYQKKTMKTPPQTAISHTERRLELCKMAGREPKRRLEELQGLRCIASTPHGWDGISVTWSAQEGAVGWSCWEVGAVGWNCLG